MREDTEERLKQAYEDWIKEHADDKFWFPFAITCVFKSQHFRPAKNKWLDRYSHKVLWKINKRIYRRADSLDDGLVFCWQFYEFDIQSKHKSLSDARAPHHIHGVVCIDPANVYKVWDSEQNCLNARLLESFASIPSVQSVLMEPLRLDGTRDWINYITKRKDLDDAD